MARIKRSDTLSRSGEAFASPYRGPQANLAVGGYNAYTPALNSFVAGTGGVKQNLIATLLEAPRGFKDLPNPQVWTAVLRNLIEVHAQSIEGIDSTLTPEFVERPIGGDGNVHHDLVDMKRAQPEPAFLWPELYGNAVKNFWEAYMLNVMMDPITKVPRSLALAANAPQDLLADYASFTTCFFEPDPTHTKVLNAWICSNMMPKVGPNNTGTRNLSSANERPEHSMGFTALTQVGDGALIVAQRVLDRMNLTGVNPNSQAPVLDDIDPSVADATSSGFAARAAEAAAGLGQG